MQKLEGCGRTKYVQSRLDGVYTRIQSLLREDDGYFSAVPTCQTHA